MISKGEGWGTEGRHLLALDRKVFRHPRNGLQFLVGRLGKGKHCLIGGTWEPCDGPPPGKDPSVLTATAVRTVKAATGLDLSACLQWCLPTHPSCFLTSPLLGNMS